MHCVIKEHSNACFGRYLDALNFVQKICPLWPDNLADQLKAVQFFFFPFKSRCHNFFVLFHFMTRWRPNNKHSYYYTVSFTCKVWKYTTTKRHAYFECASTSALIFHTHTQTHFGKTFASTRTLITNMASLSRSSPISQYMPYIADEKFPDCIRQTIDAAVFFKSLVTKICPRKRKTERTKIANQLLQPE